MTERERTIGSISPNEDSTVETPGDPPRKLPDPAAENLSEEIPEEFKQPVVLEVTDILDLHPFQPREVAEVVTTYLEEARKKGFAAVRIIHGKGTGTQREIVRSVLRKTSFVTAYEDAPAQEGGWGATVAWLADSSR